MAPCERLVPQHAIALLFAGSGVGCCDSREAPATVSNRGVTRVRCALRNLAKSQLCSVSKAAFSDLPVRSGEACCRGFGRAVVC